MRPIPVFLVGLIGVLAACGDGEPFNPPVESLAGSYSATTFTLTTASGTVDLLQRGAEVVATLADEGTTTGRLFVPGAGETEEDFDEDLTGSWTLRGSTVTFDHGADTFIRDVEFRSGEP